MIALIEFRDIGTPLGVKQNGIQVKKNAFEEENGLFS